MARKKFNLDKRNGKFLGVCAGIAEYTGWDATLIRVGAVLVTVMGAFPWTLIAYGVAAWVAKPRSRYDDDRDEAGMLGGARRRSSVRDMTESMSDIDRRLAAIDSYVAGSDSRLAREIEELR
jgi:phage shock protein C